jgi:hypothetical protein
MYEKNVTPLLQKKLCMHIYIYIYIYPKGQTENARRFEPAPPSGCQKLTLYYYYYTSNPF